MADTQLIISEILSQFGEYFLNHGQRQQDIRKKLYYGFETAGAFTLVPTNDTVIRMSEAEVTEVLQPYQDAYTPKGQATFKPFELVLKQIKVDQQFNPNKLVNSWLGFLTTNSTDRTTWPFIRWFVEEYLIPKVQEDFEKNIVYNGVYAAPTAGTAGNASTSMNGIKKVINDLIAANDVTPIATGAFPADPADFVTSIEEFVEKVPENYWNQSMELNMSHSLALRYRRGMRAKYNMHYAQMSELNAVSDFGVQIMGRFSHNGSEKIWMTPKENAIMGLKGAENQGTFEIEKVDRNVKIYTDFFAGIGFVMPSILFTNDQDLS